MNGKRRADLRNALYILGKAAVIVDSVCDREQDSIDNTPENLQNTDRYDMMKRAVENLNEAADKIDEAKEYIETAMR